MYIFSVHISGEGGVPRKYQKPHYSRSKICQLNEFASARGVIDMNKLAQPMTCVFTRALLN